MTTDRHGMVLGHPFPGDGFVFPALVATTGIKGMARDDHREFSPGTLQRRLQPLPLRGVHLAQDPGIDGNQGEPLRLYLEERAPLPAGAQRKFQA